MDEMICGHGERIWNKLSHQMYESAGCAGEQCWGVEADSHFWQLFTRFLQAVISFQGKRTPKLYIKTPTETHTETRTKTYTSFLTMLPLDTAQPITRHGEV